MTKVVHPYSHRLVILRGWKSRWFADRKKFKNNLRSDVLLREYLDKYLDGKYVSLIEFERSRKFFRVIINTSRPGMIIGRSGEGADKLKVAIRKFMNKNGINIPEELKIDIVETKNPESNAAIVAQMVADGLKKRMPFRRVLKQAAEKVEQIRGVKGVRILVAGRLGGAEMARRESVKRGSIPLSTLRADIDFARKVAVLPYGGIGIKVWIYKGEVFEDKK